MFSTETVTCVSRAFLACSARLFRKFKTPLSQLVLIQNSCRRVCCGKGGNSIITFQWRWKRANVSDILSLVQLTEPVNKCVEHRLDATLCHEVWYFGSTLWPDKLWSRRRPKFEEIPRGDKLAILTFRLWRTGGVSHVLGERVTVNVNARQSRDLFSVSAFGSLIRKDPRISFHGESRATIGGVAGLALRVKNTSRSPAPRSQRLIKSRVAMGRSWIEGKKRGENAFLACVQQDFGRSVASCSSVGGCAHLAASCGF